MPIVEIDNISKSFGANQVLKGVSFAVERGQVIAVIGRSGSGKSTMLRCINGLETIGSGNIVVMVLYILLALLFRFSFWVLGQIVFKRRRRLGAVRMGA